MAEVTGITGQKGDYTVSVKLSPRYVNKNCTACGECGKAVTAEIPNAFNYKLNKIKAAYIPNAMAYPMRYVLDPSSSARPSRQGQGCMQIRRDRSRYESRDDPNQSRRGGVGDRLAALRCGQNSTYGYDRFANVITSVEFERLADPWPHWRQDPAPIRRQGSEERRLYSMRRFARRESSAPLLTHLLHGVVEANQLCH